MFTADTPESRSDASTIKYSFGLLGVMYVVLGWISKTKPFTPLLIAAILNCFLIITTIFPLLTVNSLNNDMPYYIWVPIVQCVITYFLIRSVIYSRKYSRLLQ
jgi:hypothetical protein